MKLKFDPLRLLESLDSSFDKKELSWPLVTYVGSKYNTSMPKIIFVGKATYGWDDGSDTSLNDLVEKFDECQIRIKLKSLPTNFINNQIIKFYSGNGM